ncbi:D-inositol-3-phosphate glycosyltransferase [Dyadobacter sp. CECT 9275]|uniref:D-inositol-3-phosphate glycosyltransferase n=1 Tax=Dyadobacter helix TaxID=2822344 RepID=A0A916JEW4_9BACT|nr:glycosyltransferase family 4 protein [Dyadobacter sp. CECT 9275]CAG4998621.1 D-inositol-3-phosphate glycosyltransferase [Dyadobacter sp. CECT 9275]
MRVLVIHNQLWAHYKSKLFAEIHKVFEEKFPDSSFFVTHIADHEASRGAMKNDDSISFYHYPYQVLFHTNLEAVGFKNRLVALFRAFHRYNPTVLNVTGYFDWAQVLLMCYARLKGVKIVLSTESSTADHNRSVIKEMIKSRIVGLAHACFCFGSSSAQYLKTLGVPDDRIAVKNAAVIDESIIRTRFDKAREAGGKTGNSFIFVGRLALEKNLEMLINAFKKVNQSAKHSWKLLLVGNGPEEEKLRTLAAGDPLIEFAGSHAWYTVPEFLAKSDVLILPSKSEPWGLVVNEAMVCSMPVIVSEKCGCAPDLVRQGQNGYLFHPDQIAELETALASFINNPEQIVDMGAKSMEIIKPFSSTNVAAEMVACYEKLNDR